MPRVNVKYDLTLDATVDLSLLRFEGTEINYQTNKNGTNYTGKVKDVRVDDTLLINMQLTGPAGKWKLAAFVRRIDADNVETGDWKPLNANDKDSFENNIKTKNKLYGRYKINW